MMPSVRRLRIGSRGASGAALVAVLSSFLAVPDLLGFAPAAQDAQTAPAPAGDTAGDATLSADQLDSLVAPIALYPDPLLAQCLVAATYPLDIVAAQQWLAKNSSLKGEALTKAAEAQPWDPSVQALVPL